MSDNSEICLLRGKPLKEHSIEDIQKELQKRRLNDKGTNSELIERLENNVLGLKCSPHGTRSQSRSKVVVSAPTSSSSSPPEAVVVNHRSSKPEMTSNGGNQFHKNLRENHTAIDPRGKQCFHCGVKQKVLTYILPRRNGMIFHFCSAECRFSAQIPKHDGGGGHGETSKSQNDNHQTFFDEKKDGLNLPAESVQPTTPVPFLVQPEVAAIEAMSPMEAEVLPLKKRRSHAEKFLKENAEYYKHKVFPSKLRSKMMIGTAPDDEVKNDIAPIVIKPPTVTEKFFDKPTCSICRQFKSNNSYILARHQKSCQRKMEAKQKQMEQTLEEREHEQNIPLTPSPAPALSRPLIKPFIPYNL